MMKCSVDPTRGHEWRFFGAAHEYLHHRARRCRKCGLPYRVYGYRVESLFEVGPGLWPIAVPADVAELILTCLP